MKSSFTKVAGYGLDNRGSNPGIVMDHSVCSVHRAIIHQISAGFSWGDKAAGA